MNSPIEIVKGPSNAANLNLPQCFTTITADKKIPTYANLENEQCKGAVLKRSSCYALIRNIQ